MCSLSFTRQTYAKPDLKLNLFGILGSQLSQLGKIGLETKLI